MFDTIRLFKRGKNGVDFRMIVDCFKRQVNENNEVIRYYNLFDTEAGGKIYVECDDVMKQGVNISFSVPLIVNGNQIDNVKISDYNKLLINLYKTLNDKIEIDIEKMNVSRLDITSNLITDYEAKNYISALSRNYINQNNYKTELFKSESFTIYNKSRRFIIYDKIAEILQRGGKVSSKMKSERNVLRYEIQNKKGRDVKALLKRDYKFAELWKESVFLDCIDVQGKYYKRLFLDNKEQINIFETDRQLIAQMFHIKGKKMLVSRFLVKKYLDSGLMSFQDLENVVSDYYTQRGLRKIMKELRELKYLTVDCQYSMLKELEVKINQLHKLVA